MGYFRHNLSLRECWERSKVSGNILSKLGKTSLLYLISTESRAWEYYPEVKGIEYDNPDIVPEKLYEQYQAWALENSDVVAEAESILGERK